MTEPRAIFITGAASGIGRATAQLFASRGWLVGCADTDDAGLKALKAEIGAVTALYYPLDVTDRASVLAAISAFGHAAGGRLDVMFNNAGIIRGGFLDEMLWEEILRVVSVNLVGVLSGIHAAIPLLKATPGSLCASTSSAAAIFGTARISVYSATKHAVKGLTEALSVELARYGVRAIDVLPGVIDTAMVSADMRERLPSTGMWRLVSAAAVAEAVWAAYHGDLLHIYIPPELHELTKAVAAEPEAIRDRRRTLLTEEGRLV